MSNEPQLRRERRDRRWSLAAVGVCCLFASIHAGATPTVQSIKFLAGVQSGDNTCDLSSGV